MTTNSRMGGRFTRRGALLAASTAGFGFALPGQAQAVFTLHVEVEPLAAAIDSPDKAARLHDAIESMSDSKAKPQYMAFWVKKLRVTMPILSKLKKIIHAGFIDIFRAG